MTDHFHKRLDALDSGLRRHIAAPTVPIHDLVSPSGGSVAHIFGGDNAGPSGIAVVTGAPVTVTLSRPTGGNGLLYIIGGWYSDHGNTTFVSSVADSLGRTDWIYGAVGSRPVIGLASVSWARPAPIYAAWIETFSACRFCYAGEYGIGDTVTLTMGNIAGVSEIVLMAFNFINVKGFAVGNNEAFGSVQFNDGIDYDVVGTPPFPTLSYVDSYAENVSPVAHALSVSAGISYPPIDPYTPLNGAFIGNIKGSSISLGASMKTVKKNATADPGMTLVGATYGVANYQLIATG